MAAFRIFLMSSAVLGVTACSMPSGERLVTQADVQQSEFNDPDVSRLMNTPVSYDGVLEASGPGSEGGRVQR